MFFYIELELTEWQIGKTENALEQYIVSRVYVFALYPNGDGDVDRDRVIQEHITKLDLIITPSHRDLRIPKTRLGECPWPPAQRELKMLSAYKTPSDKLKCIIRACSVIVNLLSSSSEKVVAADDFVPVLVYVLIKVPLLFVSDYIVVFLVLNSGVDVHLKRFIIFSPTLLHYFRPFNMLTVTVDRGLQEKKVTGGLSSVLPWSLSKQWITRSNSVL